MSRLVDFEPSDEFVVVNRIVQMVHMIIDREFGQAAPPAPRRYARTEFSLDEPTVNQPMPAMHDNGMDLSSYKEFSSKAQSKWIILFLVFFLLAVAGGWYLLN